MKLKKLFAVLSAAALIGGTVPVMSSFAATTKTNEISENFYSSEINSELWKADGGAEAISYGGAIKIVNGDFATSVGWKGLRDNVNANGVGNGITGDYSLEVTASMMNGSWLGFYLGVESVAARFSSIQDIDGARGSILILTTGGITHYVGQGVKATDNSATVAEGSEEAQEDAAAHNSVYPISSNKRIRNDGTRYCLKFVTSCDAEGQQANRAHNFVKVYMVPEPENRTKDTVIDYGEEIATISYANTQGYFGFGSTNTGVATFSYIKLSSIGSDGTETVVYTPKDDLVENTVEHAVGSTNINPEYEFRVWNSATQDYTEMINNGIVGKLRLSDESLFTYKNAVQISNGTYSQYDIETYINLRELSDKQFRVILGSDGETEGALYFQQDDDEIVLKDYEGTEIPIPSGVNKYGFNVKSDGKVKVYINEVEMHPLKIEKVGGNIGFASSEGQNIEAISFSMYTYELAVSDAPSVNADFTLKDPTDNRPYISSDELYLSGSASRLVGYDEIAFINARTGSMIATRSKYADYVVKFDIVDLAQNLSTNIVVMSFGKEDINATYSTAKSLILVSRGYENDENGYPQAGYSNVEALSGLKFTTGGTTIRLEDNIFNDKRLTSSSNMLNVMLIVRNRTITLYYKFSDEPESKLAIPRAVCEDVDTYGYFSLGAANISSFSIKNFSLTNLNV